MNSKMQNHKNHKFFPSPGYLGMFLPQQPRILAFFMFPDSVES